MVIKSCEIEYITNKIIYINSEKRRRKQNQYKGGQIKRINYEYNAQRKQHNNNNNIIQEQHPNIHTHTYTNTQLHRCKRKVIKKWKIKNGKLTTFRAY